MSNVLFVYEREIPTIRLLREKYANLSKCRVTFLPIRSVRNKCIENNDVIILIRPSDPLSLAIGRKASKSGAFVVFYTDDDLIDLPKTTPFSRYRRKLMLKNAQASDMVLAANRHICEKYSKYTRFGRFAETITSVDYLDLPCIESKITETNNNPTKIVYAAGNGHERVFNMFVGPIFQRLIDKYKEKISFTFVCVHPDIGVLENENNITFKEGMGLAEYREYMSEQKFDIGIAPLEDSEFSKCKHYNKYLEYTASGIVGVYSNCEPYTNVVIDKENGILAENDPESWFDAICFAIDNPEERKAILEKARDQILNDFTSASFERKLYHDIPELTTTTKDRKRCHSFTAGHLMYTIFLYFDRLYLFLFYLKTNRGYILKKMKSRFKKAK